MPRQKSPVTAYCRHKLSNIARCWVGGRWVSLGKWNTPESRRAHARLCAEIASAPAIPTAPTGPARTVDEVLLAFWRFAEQHYRRPEGTLNEFVQAFGPLRELYGSLPAAEFGPLKLKTVRHRMIDPSSFRRTSVIRLRWLDGRACRVAAGGVTSCQHASVDSFA